MAHAVNGLVYARFLLDIGVAARDIGFGLVIVIVTDEIFDRIVGEEAFKFAVQLRRQNLVRRKDKCGPLQRLNDFSDGKGFTGTGDAQKDLILLAGQRSAHQFFDCGWLVACWFIIGNDFERATPFKLRRAFRPVRGEAANRVRFFQPTADNQFSHVRYMCCSGCKGKSVRWLYLKNVVYVVTCAKERQNHKRGFDRLLPF